MPAGKRRDPKPLRLREFVARLRHLGVVAAKDRGKGSEIILIRPRVPGTMKGPQYPIKNHGPHTMIQKPVIRACLNMLGIDEDEFWSF